MIRPILRGLTISAALLAAGCVSLLPETEPPKPRYHIVLDINDAGSAETIDWSLIIDDPQTTRVYDTSKMAVATAPGKVEYFARGEWADRAPRLFRTALLQSFEDSNRMLSVGSRDVLPIADRALLTNIRTMELNVHAGRPEAVVSVYARLTNGRATIFAAQSFTARAEARSQDPDNVAAAFNAAFNEVIGKITAWTFAEGGVGAEAAS
ncbi:MAG: ABC-type transport auxiliary lipoprotein family protein [Pseudomonadota bacterium]